MQRPAFEGPWKLAVRPYGPDEDFRYGSLMMSGNGYLGFRGGFPDFRKEEYAGCIVSDTYDCADGKWKELCTVPNALFAEVRLNKRKLSIHDSVDSRAGHALDFRYGETSGTASGTDGDLCMNFHRFASFPHLHCVWQRIELTSETGCRIDFLGGIDADPWSLNGRHFRTMELDRESGLLRADMVTSESGLPVSVVSGLRIQGTEPGPELHRERTGLYLVLELTVPPRRSIVIDQCMSVYSGNDTPDPGAAALKDAARGMSAGFDTELMKHRAHWDGLWQKYDISIDGDEEIQSLVRYNTYHNVIATPAHTDHLPIGARGLSCQAYQGAAFWDQEIFNLPMYIYTDPPAAAGILSYRYHTLPGALEKAKRLGYEGAYYPWISGDSGEELCPDHFFIDVLTGRKIRNHFNDWQIHISPDISYAVWEYYRATLDEEFLRTKGAEILFRVGQFLYSRVHYSPARERYEIIRVLGPDEYHENVDNNAFTNYQTCFALKIAAELFRRLEREDPDHLAKLSSRLGLAPPRVAEWEEMAQKLYLPQPDPESLLIEQFDGYFRHEDILPGPLAERLQKESEYWGWPNGIAFATQVIKQADVIQLFALHPFDKDVIAANYEYYEPRSQHRSSLSPGVHALVAARTGNMPRADEYLRRSLKIDIADTHPPDSGGTFIGGIHTAACGIAWQIVVKGFLGMEVSVDELRFQPRLPRGWNKLALSLRIRGVRIHLEARPDSLSLEAEDSAAAGVSVLVGEDRGILKPASRLVFNGKFVQ
jgi:1,2-alpha-glucosylglycerol phosphorylase